MRKIMLKKVSFMVDFVNFKRYNKQTFGKRWDGSVLNIVLVEPEIPQNCGNIARTCAATGSVLHLVKPLGFDISDKAVKRAGLDYWHLVDVRDYENLDDFFSKNDVKTMRLFSTKAREQRITRAPCLMRYSIVGRAATIRLSLVILPSLVGTLKSQRHRTRLPDTSMSSMDFLL